MENFVLQLRPLALKDANQQIFNETLFYVKKLSASQTAENPQLILQESDLVAATVLSANETFVWCFDEGSHCQILFLSSDGKSTVLADIIFFYHQLLEMLQDTRYHTQQQVELPCSINLENGYLFDFTLQSFSQTVSTLSAVASKKKSSTASGFSRRSIRGHSMKLTNFSHPVFCALCNGFIWGFRHQGYQCVKCLLVTDKKCSEKIPFWCQKATQREPLVTDKNVRLKFHIDHQFRPHDATLLRSFVSSDHGHCCHCGSKIIFRHGLKCKQCHLIVHENCSINVPPMCGMPYHTLADILKSEVSDLSALGPIRLHKPRGGKGAERSTSSSFDISWLDQLPPFIAYPQNCDIILPKATDFKCLGRLGGGAYAQVYCVQHVASKQYLAIKVADATNREARQQLEVERQILFRYSHENPYMIKAYCAFHQGNRLFLVMELVQGGTLYEKISKRLMTEDEIKFYVAEIICVLRYLHRNRIVYRDLKLEHAIVCPDGNLRLVDYGLGRILKKADEQCFTYCGTKSYMAPEVRRLESGIRDVGYTYQVDFWALGIVFIQMLLGEQLDFDTQQLVNEQSNRDLHLVDILKFPRYISTEAKDCAYSLLEKDPKKRLGSPQSPHGPILDHPFFHTKYKINWQEIEEGVFKSPDKIPSRISVLSDTSTDRLLSTLSVDRSSEIHDQWIQEIRSTCSPEEDEKLQSFDSIHQSAWLELMKLH